MDFVTSSPASAWITPMKIIVAGGFGVGKTTLVGTVSEITPVTTEAILTTASTPVDDTAGVPGKRATTVAMDFGRVTVSPELVLYLYGTPGQTRFWFMWDELIRGAIGAVVLVDTRRLADSFPIIDFFEDREVPYLVAVNQFDGAPHHIHEQIRDALAVTSGVPLVTCDARQRDSATHTLTTLVDHVIARRRGYRSAMPAAA
jgi:uncharacterized protein